MQRNAEKCREKQRNAEKCIRNSEKCRELLQKCREMKRKVEKCRDIFITYMTFEYISMPIGSFAEKVAAAAAAQSIVDQGKY